MEEENECKKIRSPKETHYVSVLLLDFSRVTVTVSLNHRGPISDNQPKLATNLNMEDLSQLYGLFF